MVTRAEVEPAGELNVSEPIGVMIVNLGTPQAPTPRDLRRYLREFLGDPFVDLGPPRFVWWLILNLIVLPFRPRRSAAMYKRIWTDDGSPLTVFSRRQEQALARQLGPGFRVELGYRYGKPSIRTALSNLTTAGCERVVILPLFPHDSSSSYGTSALQVERVLSSWSQGVAPKVRLVAPFFDDPGYIRSVAQRVRETLQGGTVDHFVFSYHGIPVSFIERGEPYHDQCKATSAALAAELGLAEGQWTHAYQSKFGRAEWLKPATADVVASLGEKHRRILVACPGFPADCLETIEEIGMLAVETFREHGGDELLVAPSVNDSKEWVTVMADMVRSKVSGPRAFS